MLLPVLKTKKADSDGSTRKKVGILSQYFVLIAAAPYLGLVENLNNSDHFEALPDPVKLRAHLPLTPQRNAIECFPLGVGQSILSNQN